MKRKQNALKEHDESRIIKTKAEKIIFAATGAVYAVV